MAEKCNFCGTGHRVNSGVSMFKGGKLYWKTYCSDCFTPLFEEISPSKVDMEEPGFDGQGGWINMTPAYMNWLKLHGKL